MLDCPWSRARDLVRTGRVELDGSVEVDIAKRVALGSEIVVRPEARRRARGSLGPERVLHIDSDVVVVSKPADTLTVPWDADDKNTLVDQVRAFVVRHTARGKKKRGRAARDPMVGVVQRLDKNTTGVLVFARTMNAKRALESQLRAHTVHRRYLAIVHGAFSKLKTFETHLLQDRGDGLRGSWGVFRRAYDSRPPKNAKRSVTHIRPLEALRGATLVACRLETGRQHQIRIHLAEAGHPLLGEHVYVREHRGKVIEAPRCLLHAAELGFVHPRTDEEVRFEDPLPSDFTEVLEALGKSARR